MPKPRYDEEEDKSWHAAVSREDCQKMANNNGWELTDIEETPEDPIFKVDCEFKGKTEFVNRE